MRHRIYTTGDTIAGTYQVLRVFGGVGASGMGVVYLVREREAPEPFVLKACQEADSQLLARFKREADVWVRIGSHPNVATALWVRDLDGQLFVAAEYVGGAEVGLGSLVDALEIDVPLELVIAWGMQFCSGMGHAIARGLVAHRDIKPANLLLTIRGELKIADFGLGRVVSVAGQEGVRGGVVSTGIAGTLPYMSPEQITGAATDHRSDIYAFGIVLYQLCSRGTYPYDVGVPADGLAYSAAHTRGKLRPLATPFWPVIAKCLARSARDRWQTPADLATAIRDVATHLGLPCPPLVPPQSVALSELYARSQSLTALGRPVDALAAIDQYLSKEPDAFWAWTEKGRILWELDRQNEAEVATRRSLALNPSNSHAWNNLGVIFLKWARYKESCDAFEKSLRCDPLNIGAMMNAAHSCCELRHHERAAVLLCDALKRAPGKQTLLFNAGNLVGKMMIDRAADPAERVSRAILAADTRNSQAWHNLGILLAQKGDREEAVRCVRTALKYEPDNADSHLFLGRLLAEAGLVGEAFKHLDQLIEQHKLLSPAVCSKAQLLVHAGRCREARKLLEEYLKESPADDSAWFISCRIAEAEGDLEGALRAARACEGILRQRRAPMDSENVRWAHAKIRELQVRLETRD
jgi:serine/threonine protein kinase